MCYKKNLRFKNCKNCLERALEKKKKINTDSLKK